jgi:hypothetical protein
MLAKLTVRTDTAANWTSSNPTPPAGEINSDSTNKRLKAGDGHLFIDSTAGFNASLANKNFEVRTVTAGKDIRFVGGTLSGNQTRFFSGGNMYIDFVS